MPADVKEQVLVRSPHTQDEVTEGYMAAVSARAPLDESSVAAPLETPSHSTHGLAAYSLDAGSVSRPPR